MQAGNTHQVRDASQPEHGPVVLRYRCLIPHHQRHQQIAGALALYITCAPARPDLLTHVQPCPIQRMLRRQPARIRQTHGTLLCTHLRRGAQPLLPHPALQIKAEGIAIAMRPAQLQAELPALARLHASLALPGNRLLRPAQRQAIRQAHGTAIREQGLLHQEFEARPVRRPLRQALHHAGDQQGLPLQFRIQLLCLHAMRLPARHAPAQTGQGQPQGRQGAALFQAQSDDAKCQQHGQLVMQQGRQAGLLQLQPDSGQPGQSASRDARRRPDPAGLPYRIVIILY